MEMVEKGLFDDKSLWYSWIRPGKRPRADMAVLRREGTHSVTNISGGKCLTIMGMQSHQYRAILAVIYFFGQVIRSCLFILSKI